MATNNASGWLIKWLEEQGKKLGSLEAENEALNLRLNSLEKWKKKVVTLLIDLFGIQYLNQVLNPTHKGCTDNDMSGFGNEASVEECEQFSTQPNKSPSIQTNDDEVQYGSENSPTITTGDDRDGSELFKGDVSSSVSRSTDLKMANSVEISQVSSSTFKEQTPLRNNATPDHNSQIHPSENIIQAGSDTALGINDGTKNTDDNLAAAIPDQQKPLHATLPNMETVVVLIKELKSIANSITQPNPLQTENNTDCSSMRRRKRISTRSEISGPSSKKVMPNPLDQVEIKVSTINTENLVPSIPNRQNLDHTTPQEMEIVDVLITGSKSVTNNNALPNPLKKENGTDGPNILLTQRKNQRHEITCPSPKRVKPTLLDHMEDTSNFEENQVLIESQQEEAEVICLEQNLDNIKSPTGPNAIQKLITEVDPEAQCAVCDSPDVERENTIIECENCNITVHQACYRVLTIPKDQWFCNPCAKGTKPDELVCCICFVRGGALKPVLTPAKNKWAHMYCVWWVDRVRFGAGSQSEWVIGLNKVDEQWYQLTCTVCKRKEGPKIQCKRPKCRVAFHPTCAKNKGFKLKLREIDNKETGDLVYQSFCKRHSR